MNHNPVQEIESINRSARRDDAPLVPCQPQPWPGKKTRWKKNMKMMIPIMLLLISFKAMWIFQLGHEINVTDASLSPFFDSSDEEYESESESEYEDHSPSSDMNLSSDLNPSDSSSSSLSHWWQPFVNDVSTIFKPSSNHTQWKWCDPYPSIQNGKSKRIGQSTLFSGIFLVKIPKTGSSTAAGVSLQIAESIGLKKGLVPLPQTRHGEPLCPSHVHHGTAYTQRLRDGASFLWTSVRQPHKRSISEYFFFRISRFGGSYNSTKFINELEGTKNYQFNYISKGMKVHPLGRTKDSLSATSTSTSTSSQLEEQLSAKQIQDLEKVSSVFQMYDFVAVAERMDESLVVLKLLNNFPDESIVGVSNKVAGGYDDGLYKNTCYKIQKSYTTEDVDHYITNHFHQDNIDFLLYAAANKTLDDTIDFLGRERVEREVIRHRKLRELAEDVCSKHIVFPCTEHHFPKRDPKSNQNCYFGDLGCGHQCMMDVIRNGTVQVL